MSHKDGPAAPAISVIVPALNEESVIGKCLASLQQQNLRGIAFEVIVVDNGSSDRTVDVARSFDGAMPVTVLERSGARIAALRNLGAAVARGEYLAFLDADCVAPRHWLQQAIDLLNADASRIVGAQYRIPQGSSWVARAWYGDLWQIKKGPVSYVPGGDLIISRELFLNLGGFDESIITSEDCEFCERAAAASVPILAIPSLSVVHLGTPQTLGDFYRKQSWHGVNVHRVFVRNIRHSKTRKAMLFAVYMLAGLAAAMAGSAAAFLYASVALAFAGFAALLLAPALLASRDCAVRKQWNHWLPLVALYLAYGTARALCLLGFSGARKSRKPAGDAHRAPAQLPGF